MSPRRPVARTVRLHLHNGLIVPSSWQWHPDDPFAVRVAVGVGAWDTRTVMLTRGMLVDAARGPVSNGPVRLAPVARVLRLTAGPLHLFAPLGEVAAFVAATEASVPDAVAWDDLLTAVALWRAES